jgi:sialate O-acetylesterase
LLKKDSVIVSNPNVPDPVAVRYGWASYLEVDLTNSEGLPAAPFRTDNW